VRRTWHHQPPATTQPAPADNTDPYVAAQIETWQRGGSLPHPEAAMEIAAWWHAPDTALAAFSHTGTITDSLVAEIDAELAGPGLTEADQRPLEALRAYLLDCTVTAWAVGDNTAGYLPETDPYLTLDYADAVQAFRDLLTEAPEQLAGEPDDCTCVDGGEACEVHALEATVESYLHDDVPNPVGGRVSGPQRELAVTLRCDSQPLPREFWLHRRGPTTVRQYLAESGSTT
jgi:hypothetical protein